MPELPEVETIVRGLNRNIRGRRVASVRVLDEKCLQGFPAPAFVRALAGRTFARVGRFGKYLEFVCDDGSVLVAHLRMTGKFIFLAPGVPDGDSRHLRLSLLFEDGSRLLFQDMRRFGTIRSYPAGAVLRERAVTGPDPLQPGLGLVRFVQILGSREQPVKVLLLDQRRISGIGNIYACEALFHAGIHPERPARSLSRADWQRLYRVLRRVLRSAIANNGTTISDYRSVDAKTGAFQAWLQVYGRDGEPCRRCRTPVVRIRQAGRSTFLCPSCQS